MDKSFRLMSDAIRKGVNGLPPIGQSAKPPEFYVRFAVGLIGSPHETHTIFAIEGEDFPNHRPPGFRVRCAIDNVDSPQIADLLLLPLESEDGRLQWCFTSVRVGKDPRALLVFAVGDPANAN